MTMMMMMMLMMLLNSFILLQYNIRLLYGWQTATILRHKMKK